MLGMRAPRSSRFVRLELHHGEAVAIGGHVLAIRDKSRHRGSQFGQPGIGLLHFLFDSWLEPSAKNDDNHAASYLHICFLLNGLTC
jgi:hypothetical protein